MVSSERLFHRKKNGLLINYRCSQFNEDKPPATLWKFGTMSAEIPDGVGAGERHGGAVCDSSFDGVCFETDYPLSRGDKVNLNMVNFREIPFGDKAFAKCEARVVWCHKVGSIRKFCYRVGAKRIREKSLPAMNLKTSHFGSVKCF